MEEHNLWGKMQSVKNQHSQKSGNILGNLSVLHQEEMPA